MLHSAIGDELAHNATATLPAGIHLADISRWQGQVDLGAYHAAGHSAIILKLGGGDDGLYVDSAYKTRAGQARSNGLDVAGYFFNGPAAAPKAAERFCEANLTGFDATDHLIIDVEGNAGTVWSPAQASDFIDAFRSVHPQGRALVYMSASLTRSADWSAVAKKAGLYVASYGADDGTLPAGSPLIEHWAGWDIWQYTSKGHAAGIGGAIDLDYARAGVFGVPAPKPAPAPAPRTKRYTVVSGDTLGAIATRFHLSLAQLEKLNPQIKDPNRIQPGQVLTVA